MIKAVDKFLPHKIYTMLVTVTNTSESMLYPTLLMQLPTGSIGLVPPETIKTENLQLNRYSTITLQMSFYFPDVGDYAQYPPNVSLQGKVVASAQASVITVRESYQVDTLQSFRDIAAAGNKDQVIEYLRKHGIQSSAFDVTQCFWMLNDKEFYTQITQLYREYHEFNQSIWAFACKHEDWQGFIELIRSSRYMKNDIGPYFTCNII